MEELKSILDYLNGSPYGSHPYLSLFGDELPPFQKKAKGGYSAKQIYDYIMKDDEPDPSFINTRQDQEDYQNVMAENSKLTEENELLRLKREKDLQDQADLNAAMSIIYEMDEDTFSNSQSPSSQSSGSSAGFRTFATYQEGRNALENQLKLYQTGKTRNPVKPTSTLLEAMSVYAPASDNNDPTAYANTIAKQLGITPETPISQIDTKKWADVIEKVEGNKKGNNPGNLRPTPRR